MFWTFSISAFKALNTPMGVLLVSAHMSGVLLCVSSVGTVGGVILGLI